MRDPAVLQSQIADALARGATVLVPNPRAAHAVGRQHPQQNQLCLRQPDIVSWRAWSSRLWHSALLTGAVDRLLLNRTQEQTLWRGLIEAEPAVSSLRDPGSLARLAAEAWGELAQHDGLKRVSGSATNGDTETFARLAAAFDQMCRREGYLPEAGLESALARAVQEKKLVAEEKELLLCGFDRLLPAQRALLQALEHNGVAIKVLPHAPPTANRGLWAAEDEQEELRAAMAWCKARMDEQPDARIALLVPGLRENGMVAQLERLVRAALAPGAGAIDAAPASLPYDIVAGSPLAQTALVSGALNLLAWTLGPLPLERVEALLLSPYLGRGPAGPRAEFDAFELRRARTLRPEVELEWLVNRMARSPRRDHLAHLIAGLRAVGSMVRRHLRPEEREERRPWGEWTEGMRELLNAAGWAGEPAVNAAELEAQRAWESLLDELATLDFAGVRVSWQQAVSTLRQLAEETMLTPAFRDAPVQIMTPEDAEGIGFDAMWFLRAGDVTWPASIRSSPLLSWSLKRELGMPGPDFAADQAHASQQVRHLAGAAGSIVFSYAREAAEEKQRVSPALDGLALQAMSVEPGAADDAPEIELEAVLDRSRLPPPAGGPISGGAAVLRAQAACGFRAFAERRLFATALDPREAGMDARERGEVVHRVLERFWERVEKQDVLRRMTLEERDARLAESIDFALSDALNGAGPGWDQAYLETQRQRLMSLGRRWLTLELERRLPFTVARRESETRDAAIGPLRLSLRVDRIDQTDHGAVLIDYKTGKAGHLDWLGERPNEPQLPLYAVLAGEHLHAIGFGAVRAGQYMSLSGFEEQPGALAKPAELKAASLEAQIQDWERVLTRLATDFWNGDARVLPKEFPATCKYCAQRLLCRLDAAALLEDEEDEDEELDEEELPV